MKRLLLIILTLLPTLMQARHVPQDMAVHTAAAIMTARVGSNFQGAQHTVQAVQYEGATAYYVINYTRGGWAILSADDEAQPLIAYSPTGRFETQGQPENLSGWMQGYARLVKHCIDNPCGRRNEGWDTGSWAVTRAPANAIEPLIPVKWNQGSPYNKYCPGGSVVGCVAVALGQAMSVFKYPTQPTGTHGYSSPYGLLVVELDKVQYDWNAIISGANGKDDIAQFLYHCGVVVDMNYSPSGSGTQSSKTAQALKEHFGYPSSVTHVSRSSYINSAWQQLLVGELETGNPIIYSGYPPKGGSGHCFNLDGYDGNTMFHVNWGWGGSGDGYFTLDGLKTSADYDYTSGQAATIGIHVVNDAPSNITLSSYSIPEGIAVGSVVADVTVESNAKNPDWQFTIRGEYSPVLHKYLDVPFEVRDGKLVTTAEISKAKAESYIVDITVTNRATDESYTKRSVVIYITGAGDAQLGQDMTLSYDRATRVLTITSANRVAYNITSADDEMLGDGVITPEDPAVVELGATQAQYITLTLTSGPQTREINIKLR